MQSVSDSKYVWCLFTNFLDEMRVMKEMGSLWMNENELNKKEFAGIKELLFGGGKIFDALSIDRESIPSVQHFRWNIAGDDYEKLKTLAVSKYILSPQFVYFMKPISNVYRIPFCFRFYGQYSAAESQCAIFLEIDEMLEEVKRLQVEVDMKCIKRQLFRQLLRNRMVNKEDSLNIKNCLKMRKWSGYSQ